MLHLRTCQHLYRVAPDAEPEPLWCASRWPSLFSEVKGTTALYVRCRGTTPLQRRFPGPRGAQRVRGHLVEDVPGRRVSRRVHRRVLRPGCPFHPHRPPRRLGGADHPGSAGRPDQPVRRGGGATAVWPPLVWSDTGPVGVALDEGQAVDPGCQSREPVLATGKGLPPPLAFGRQRFLVGLTWNPDGSALAVSSLTPERGRHAPGGRSTPRPGGPASWRSTAKRCAPPWSPDGEVLISPGPPVVAVRGPCGLDPGPRSTGCSRWTGRRASRASARTEAEPDEAGLLGAAPAPPVPGAPWRRARRSRPCSGRSPWPRRCSSTPPGGHPGPDHRRRDPAPRP